MQEQGFYLKRFNNGSPAKRSEIFANLSAEWWSTVGQLVERMAIILPNDEKLVAQLTSRRKMYDSRGRERLESKGRPPRPRCRVTRPRRCRYRQSDGFAARELRELREEIRRARPGPGRYGGLFGRTHLEW
jgi:hypothetical protein